MNSKGISGTNLTDLNLAIEFAQIVRCELCTSKEFTKLQRDVFENVPQPGYVGIKYPETRVMLVGQNPGVCSERNARVDAKYTDTLRKLRDNPSTENFQQLRLILDKFVPTWHLHGKHFPLKECHLDLDQIAYCNIVRCRTRDNSTPYKMMARKCIKAHFERWLDFLKPRVVVFLGKWPHAQAATVLERRNIPNGFINRMRSLNSHQRAINHREIVDLILKETGQLSKTSYRSGDSLVASNQDEINVEENMVKPKKSTGNVEQNANYSFWQEFLPRAKRKTSLHALVKPRSKHWIGVTSGISGAHYNYVVRKHDAFAKLDIECRDEDICRSIFNHLKSNKASIEAKIGRTLNWSEVPERRARRIELPVTIGGRDDVDKWPEIHDAMIDAMILLESALRPYIEELI